MGAVLRFEYGALRAPRARPGPRPIPSNAKINRSACIFRQSIAVGAAACGCHFFPVATAIGASGNSLATGCHDQARSVSAGQDLMDVRIRQSAMCGCPSLTLIIAHENAGNLDTGKKPATALVRFF